MDLNLYDGRVNTISTLSAAPLAMYGVRRIIKGYNGPLFQIKVGSTTMDIYPLPNGAPNIQGVAALLNGAATANVTQIYDQTGGGNIATQATAGNQAFFSLTNAILGVPSITFDGNVNIAAYYAIPVGVTGNGRASSFFSVHSYESGEHSCPGGLGTLNNTAGSLTMLANMGTTNAPSRMNVLTSGAFLVGPAVSRSQPQLQVITSGASNIHAYNDDSASGNLTINTAGTWTGGNIGRCSQPYYLYGEWYGTGIYNGELTANDVQLIKAYVYPTFNILTKFDTLLVMPGNSIVEGTKATLNQNNPRQADFNGGAATVFKRRIAVNNCGVFGQLAATQYTNRAAYLANFNAALVNNLMYCPEGTNDIQALASGSIVGGGTTIYNSYIATFVTAAKAAGFVCIVPTIIPRNWTGSALDISQKQAEATTYNGLVTSNAVASGYTAIDYTTLTPFNNQVTSWSNTTYYNSDGIHPNSTGYAIMAALLAPTVNGLI